MFTGYIPSKKDIRDFKICKESNITIPDSFCLNSYTILNQKNVSSCVAHSVATLLESIYHDTFSVGWIYGNRNYGNYSKGMTIQDALKTAQKYGCVKKKDFPVNEEVMEIINKVNSNRERLEPLAEPFKIGPYARLDNDTDIKRALMKGLPVIFATDIREDNLSMNDDYVINVTQDKVRCGHAMVLYGWNEKGWLIQNSWGTKWGDNGTAILPYEYGIDEAFAISKYENNKDIKKPKLYWLREIINLFIKILKRKKEHYEYNRFN